MEIQKLEDNNTLSTSILTFGNFDGIHLGHNFIIHKLIKLSSDNNIPSVLITFDPHTNLILNKIKKNDFKILTSFKQKCDILNSYKIDFLCKISFDKHFSKISASDFMDLIIKQIMFQTLMRIINLIQKLRFQYWQDFLIIEEF